jgi:Arc/MetJ-type ribon-helix-helix transcriptional regulator
MTTQIAVRLPDELVIAIDELVADGSEPSRAAIVSRALTRELRRLATLREIEILHPLGGEPYPDLAELTEWASHQAVDIE